MTINDILKEAMANSTLHRKMYDTLYVNLYNEETGEDLDILVNVESSSLEPDEIPEVQSVKLDNSFSFSGKSYRSGADFDPELMQYISLDSDFSRKYPNFKRFVGRDRIDYSKSNRDSFEDLIYVYFQYLLVYSE